LCFESEVPEERGALLNDGAAIMFHFALLNDGAAIMFHFGIQDIGGGAYLFGAIMVTAQVDFGGRRASLAGWRMDGNIFCTQHRINSTRRDGERDLEPQPRPRKIHV